MSSKNYKIIHNKTLPQFKFRDDPLQINEQFQVYLPLECNKVEELINKDRLQTKTSLVDRLAQSQQGKMTSPKVEKGVTFESKIDRQQEDQREVPNQQQETGQTNKINHNSNSMASRTLTLKQLKGSLLFDERTNSIPKTTIQNHILDEIVKNGEIIVSKPHLVDQVQKLKRLQLLKQYNSNHQLLPGIGKLPYVMNDYHSKSTNNGYSRNNKGAFYTR